MHKDKTRTRILVICLDMDPESLQGDQHTGAAHLYVRETLMSLTAHDVDCMAITRWDDKNKSERQVYSIGKGSIELVRIQIGDVNRQPKEFLFSKRLESRNRILEVLRSNSFVPDIIHAVYWYSGDVALDLLNYYPSAKLLYTVVSLGLVKHQWKYRHGESKNNHDLSREQIEAAILTRADMIAAVSEQERLNVAKYYSIDLGKVYTIGRGVDAGLFSPPFLDKDSSQSLYFPHSDQRVLLYVGRIIESKGYDFLLQVYDTLLTDPTIAVPPIWFVGGTAEEIERARKTIHKGTRLSVAEDEGRIFWWGALPRTVLPHLYRRALVTCVPSYYEPGARVIIESMSCGTPVIMGPTGYGYELVRKPYGNKGATFENGFVVSTDRVEGWAALIKGIIRDGVWREALSKRAYYSVMPHFSLEQFYSRHWELYRSLVSGTSPCLPSIDFSRAVSVAARWNTPFDQETRDLAVYSILSELNPALNHSEDGKYVLKKLDDVDGSTSTYSLKYGNNRFFVKQFIDRTLFYKRFFPIQEPSNVQAAKMRFVNDDVLEIVSDAFFLPVRLRDFGSLSVIYPFAERIMKEQWDKTLVEEALSALKGFHTRQRNNSKYDLQKSTIECMRISKDVTWTSLNEIVGAIIEANAIFRDGGKWYSPCRLDLDLALIHKSLDDNVWSLYHEDRLFFLSCLDRFTSISPTEIHVIWGECRPEHFVFMNGQLMAIDTESISFGEEAYDYASFFFWKLDVLNLEGYDRQLAKEILEWAGEFVPDQVERVKAWLWVICLYWYMRDYSRGYLARLNRFKLVMEYVAA